MARAIKRVIDFVVALLVLLVCSPLIAALAVAIRLKMGSPVLFRQTRPGLRGRPIRVLKFRTMNDARDAAGCLLADDYRVTRFGQWLRKLSLDELPQLWNVLTGDISLVGPRPLLMQYLERYTPEQARRHEAKPGITGWAQVRGRNAISWEQKFELDVWYVDHWSLWLDFCILAETVWRVLQREGISQDGYATMPEFMGSETAKTGSTKGRI